MHPHWTLVGAITLAMVTGPRDPAPPVTFHRIGDCARFQLTVLRDGRPVPGAIAAWTPPHFSTWLIMRADREGRITSRCFGRLRPLHPCLAVRPFDHPFELPRTRERRRDAYELDLASSHGMQCWVRVSEHDLVLKTHTRVVLRQGYETRVTVELR